MPIIPIDEEYLVTEENKEALIEILKFAFRKVLKENGQYGILKAKWTDSKGIETNVKISLD